MNLESLTSQLRAVTEADDEQNWPGEGVGVLSEAGCFKHIVPRQFGGEGAEPAAQLAAYEAIASESVTLALILTQHDAAAEVLGAAAAESVAAEILRKCVSGEELLTVGISQVTTSRRHGRAAMRARRDGEGFVLDGVMPWVTSARRADHIVTAAVLDDGQQILACVPTDAQGVSILEPMRLLALQSSWTSEVRCEAVQAPRSWVLRGPMESVLARRAPVKGLTVSSVGIGMASALLREVSELAGQLAGADTLLRETMEPRYQAARRKLLDAANSLHDPASESPAVAIRAEVNAIVNRLAATLMTLAKGTGFLSTRPTQRLLRESAFFLVWSAAPPVQLETLHRIWDAPANSNGL
ncbi:MAG: acyl-CoA dehydrogenase family protein [Pirellulaceae bacterium]|nr:acyl-CoA dehydrogenase family protein [Pirellulaceae bacterium]MDP7020280.1 acyl-CoA dehydrogenase family protein [Pirellulaceae bacterium]